MAQRCWSTSFGKRAFDLIISIAVLSAAFVIVAIIWTAVKLTSKGPALFRQQRVGLDGKLFTIYKFRTMQVQACGRGPGLTREGDHRLTPLGKVLRKLKLDELPQFYNVLRGDMSLVGPRPKLARYSASADWRYRPGITGFATLAFQREEEMLREVPPEELDAFYDASIRPIKAELDSAYMSRASFISDFVIICSTVTACLRARQRTKRTEVPQHSVPEPAGINERHRIGMSLETESID